MKNKFLSAGLVLTTLILLSAEANAGGGGASTATMAVNGATQNASAYTAPVANEAQITNVDVGGGSAATTYLGEYTWDFVVDYNIPGQVLIDYNALKQKAAYINANYWSNYTPEVNNSMWILETASFQCFSAYTGYITQLEFRAGNRTIAEWNDETYIPYYASGEPVVIKKFKCP